MLSFQEKKRKNSTDMAGLVFANWRETATGLPSRSGHGVNKTGKTPVSGNLVFGRFFRFFG